MNSVVSEKLYISQKLGIPYENLSQSYLQKAVALATQQTIVFPLQVSQVPAASQTVLDQLLNLNDEFVLTHFNVHLRTVASDSPTTAQLQATIPYTYVDTNVFTLTNSANVGAVFNGSLSFTIDRKDFIPAFDCRSFYRVPVAQSATNADYTTSGIKRTNGYDNGLYSYFVSEPVKITGRQTISVEIDLGASINLDDSSVTNYAVFAAKGYLVVNAKN